MKTRLLALLLLLAPFAASAQSTYPTSAQRYTWAAVKATGAISPSLNLQGLGGVPPSMVVGIAVQGTAPAACTFEVDGSADGTTWSSGASSLSPAQSCTATRSLAVPATANYIRLNVTAWTQGDSTSAVQFSYTRGAPGSGGAAVSDTTLGASTSAALKASTSTQAFSGPVKAPDVMIGGGPYIDARYYGVLADGATDNSAALQSAINAACVSSGVNGRAILLPSGGNINFSSSLVVPAQCYHLRMTGPGSYTPGGARDAVGVAQLNYTGNADAITLGTEATQYKTTITAASRTSNVLSITYAANTFTSQLVAGATVMVRGLTPSDLNGEVLTVVSNASNTMTLTSTGTTETASTVSGAYVDVAWDYSYYSGLESAFSLDNLALSCGSSTTSPLSVVAYGNSSTYATGSYGIHAWRNGRFLFNNLTISHCQNGVWGIESDLDMFRGLTLTSNHVGVWLGPRSDQALFDRLYTVGNDTALQLDTARQATARHWTTDSDGSATTAPLILTANYSLGGGIFLCDDCWFEDYNLSSTGGPVVQMGVGSPFPVQSVVFRNPYMIGIVGHHASFLQLDNGDGLLVDHPAGAPTAYTNFLNFSGSGTPTNLELIRGYPSLPANISTGTGVLRPSMSQFQNGEWQNVTDAPAVSGRAQLPGINVGSGANASNFISVSNNRGTFFFDGGDNAAGISTLSGKGIEFAVGAPSAAMTKLGGYTTALVPYTAITTAVASASTIAPTGGGVLHVTGSASISTITVPGGCTTSATSCDLTLIFDGAAPLATGGNIATAITTATGQAVRLVYDPATSKWYHY